MAGSQRAGSADSPQELLAIAHAAADEVAELFISGIGAPPAVSKGGRDFATEVDLAIEARLRTVLGQFTGLPCIGEEQGQVLPTAAETFWVIDPVDGTANFSAGDPHCGTLIALIHQHRPVVAVAHFPLLGLHLSAAAGSALRISRSSVGRSAVSTTTATAVGAEVGSGSWAIGVSSHVDVDTLAALTGSDYRLRMTGSVGLDAAFVATGAFAGALNFSPYPWDNAASALLIAAGGGVASDALGRPWTYGSTSLVSGDRKTHAAILAALGRREQP